MALNMSLNIECIINKEEFAEPKQDELNRMYELTLKLATSPSIAMLG